MKKLNAQKTTTSQTQQKKIFNDKNNEVKKVREFLTKLDKTKLPEELVSLIETDKEIMPEEIESLI